MIPVVVDFETFYDNDLSVVTLGLRNYVRKAEAYILSVVTPGWKFCGTIEEFGSKYLTSWVTEPQFQFWAANSNFDQAFWEKYFPETAHPWKCVLDQAAFHQLPRNLLGLAKVLLNKEMDKSTRDEMKGVVFASLPPERQQQVIEYCLNDALVTMEAVQKLPPMSPLEERLAEHTRAINRRGIRVDLDRIKRDCDLLEQLRFHAHHKIPWVSGGDKPLSYEAFCAYCEHKGQPPPASLDKRDLECTQWMERNPELGAVIENMRTFRGINTKLKKLKSIGMATDDSNIIPLDLLYCGARHTRRWSSKNINVQNLDSKPAFEEEMAELPYYNDHPDEEPGIFMREYFLPPPGKKFGILDYSQIEPRVLNWFVGNNEMLSAMRAGFGIYEAHAKATMKWSGAPGTLKHTEPDRYKFAKERVLALGYGMGWERFKVRAKTNIGVDLTDDQAKREVEDFRRSNPRITGFWKKFNALITDAAHDHQEKTVELTMPTGDTLKHFHVRGKGKGEGYHSYTVRGDFSQASHCPNLFGGLLTENVTQRGARDILAEAILRLEDNGVQVAFTAHDEAINVLDESSAEKEFAEAKRLMQIPPEWCQDLPIAVDGEIHNTYTKLK